MVKRNKLTYQSARYVAIHPLSGEAFLFPTKKEVKIWSNFIKGQFGLDVTDVKKIEKLKSLM